MGAKPLNLRSIVTASRIAGSREKFGHVALPYPATNDARSTDCPLPRAWKRRRRRVARRLDRSSKMRLSFKQSARKTPNPIAGCARTIRKGAGTGGPTPLTRQTTCEGMSDGGGTSKRLPLKLRSSLSVAVFRKIKRPAVASQLEITRLWEDLPKPWRAQYLYRYLTNSHKPIPTYPGTGNFTAGQPHIIL